MSFRDGSARKGWSSRWRGSKRTSTERREPQLAAAPSTQNELVLWLDAAGCVIACSEALAGRLSPDLTRPGTHLRDLVRKTFTWLDKTVAEWPTAIPLLTFNTAGGAALYCAGVVERGGEDWRLFLVDISAAMVRLDQQDSKALLLRKTADLAARIRAGHGGISLAGDALTAQAESATEGAVADWLELLSLRLKIPWAAVGSLSGGERRLCGLYQRPGAAVELPDFAVIQHHLAAAGQHGPLRCQLEGTEKNGETLWLIPHWEDGRLAAWLCCGDYRAREGDLRLSDEEWCYLFGTVAAALLRALQRRDEEIAGVRQAAVEQLRCGGWWEYQPGAARLRLAPALLERLDLPVNSGWLSAEQWLPLVDPVDRDAFRVRLDTAQTGRTALALRLLIAGGTRWFQWEGEVIDGPQGRRITGFALDIHDVKMREEEAASAESRFKGLIDSAPALIYVMACQDGALRPAFCSASIETLLGWKADGFLQRPYASYVHADDRETYFHHTRTLLQSGRSSCQYRVRHSGGQYRWLQDEALLLRNDRGLPVEVVGLCLDISESRTAAERVAASEERYRVLVEDSPAIICRYRPDLSMTFANRMLAVSVGLPLLRVESETMTAFDLSGFISAEDRDKAMRRFAAMTPENPNADFELCVRCGDGRHRWWLVSERGLFDKSGTLVEIQAVARDDTELHEARQQLFQSAKMATLGQMATGLAHEINQPLNVMHMSVTNLLTRLSRDEADQEYLVHKLERVAEQIQRTATIVDHMRIFGRQSDIEGVVFDPLESVAGALFLMEERLAMERVELQLVEQELPAVVGHSDRLAQVVLNLLINALYAVLERCRQDKSHNPLIKLECAAEGQVATIRVRDNGLGIRPEVIDRLFEPFFTTKPVGEGTGLGLSVSYSIIRQMSGRLFAENTGDGALFTIELPVARDG